MATIDFKYLQDAPAPTSHASPNLEFGHGEISRTLVTIVSRCPSPFTIGLFAKWGTGKSTLANAIKAPLMEAKIPTVIFDVWKHEGDALRRTFLKEMDRQLKELGNEVIDPKFKLSERIDQSVGQTTEGKFVFNSKKFAQIWKPLLVAVVLVLISRFVASHYPHLEAYFKWVYGAFGVGTFSALVFLLMQQSVKFVSTETTIYSTDRYEDPYQFEEEFTEILGALKRTRILIVFDNLDRVTDKKVEEVLTTIKTFLEPLDAKNSKKEVVFLIPCDAKAIKRHLANAYGARELGDFDPDEFLRKIFNTILWIPDFFPAEIESFASDRLRETGIKAFEDDNLAWLLAKAFRDNPRQIIQFVNILLSSYLLIKEREGDNKDFPSDFMERNVPQLAKFLILEQLFPRDMEGMREAKAVNLETYVREMLPHLLTTDVVKPRTNFVDFIRETMNIPISDIQIFFTLRRSVSERTFPGFSAFIEFLEDGKSEEAEKYLRDLKSTQGANFAFDFGKAMKYTLETKSNSVSLAAIVNGLMRLLSSNSTALGETIDAEFSNALDGKCRPVLHLISPLNVDSYLLSRRSSYRSGIVSLWLNLVDQFVQRTNDQVNIAFVCEVFRVITKYPEATDSRQANVLRRYLQDDRLKDDPVLADLVLRDGDTQRRFISKEYLANKVEALGVDNKVVDEILPNLAWFNRLSDSVFDQLDLSRLLTRFSEIQLFENSRGDAISKMSLMTSIAGVLEQHLEAFSALSADVNDGLVVPLMDAYNKLPVDYDRRNVIKSLFILKRFALPSRVPAIVDAIAIYAWSAPVSDFRFLLESLPPTDRSEIFENPTIFIQLRARTLAQEDFRNEFFKDFLPAEKEKFIQEFSSTHFATIFSFVGSLGEQDSILKAEYFRRTLSSFEAFVPGAKEIVLNSADKYFDVATGDELVMLGHLAGKLLTVEDPTLEEKALKMLVTLEGKLSHAAVRSITKEILDQLTDPGLINKYQVNAIEAISLGYLTLNDEEIGQFLQFLFDELIRKGTVGTHIDFGFALIHRLGIRYEDRSLNFDDVLLRISESPRGEIRSHLLRGLQEMKPSVLPKLSGAFWALVDLAVSDPVEDG